MSTSDHTDSASNFRCDVPIKDRSEDKFNRGAFAERVAKVVTTIDASEGVVVGLFGKWGEGKSSILNLVRDELIKVSSSYKKRVVDYSPWRLRDENAMFTAFVQRIAEAIEETTNPAKWRVLFRKLGALLFPIMRFLTVGGVERWAGVNVNELVDSLYRVVRTGRADQFECLRTGLVANLAKLGRRIVIIIDDIDRLDVTEIQLVFRLISTVAKLPNVIFVVAFDDKDVASSLSAANGRSGDSNNWGLAYLDKVVQVPISMPHLLRVDIHRMLVDRVHSMLKSAQWAVTERTMHQFWWHMDHVVIPSIRTPRSIDRYCNRVQFLIPLLKDEVDICDLMILEGLSEVHGPIYTLILNNYAELAGVELGNPVARARSESVRTELMGVTEPFESRDSNAMRRLIAHLFPRTSGWFGGASFGDDHLAAWSAAKRACSPEYTSRYFTRAVPADDIRTSELDQVIDQASIGNIDMVVKSLTGWSKSGKALRALYKLKARHGEIPPQAIEPLCNGILRSSIGMESYGGMWTEIFGTRPQLSILLKLLVHRVASKSGRLALARSIIEEATPLSLAHECLVRLCEGDTADSTNEFVAADLSSVLVNRLKVAGDQGVKIFGPNDSRREELLHFWADAGSHESVSDYLRKQFEADPLSVGEFLAAMAPVYANSDGDSGIGDLSASSLNNIRDLIDPETMETCIKTYHPSGFDNPEFQHDVKMDVGRRLAEQFLWLKRGKSMPPQWPSLGGGDQTP